MKKLLVVWIVVLFIMMIVPSSGNTALNDDTTPPVTTCTLDPPEPDGLNGWYVADVEVILNATDDLSGVKEIRYVVDGVPYSIPGDHGVFIIYDDGDDILVEYWAIDTAGNIEPKHSFTIDVDQTLPEMEMFYWGIYINNSKGFVRFKAFCSDETSGMDRVEFYLNATLTFIDYEEPYEWIIEWSEYSKCGVYKAMAFDNAGNSDDIKNPPYAGSYYFIGLILNPEISEGNVTFFAIIVRYKHDYGWGIPEPGRQMFKRLSFPNNYDGYIGRYFIRATFYNI